MPNLLKRSGRLLLLGLIAVLLIVTGSPGARVESSPLLVPTNQVALTSSSGILQITDGYGTSFGVTRGTTMTVCASNAHYAHNCDYITDGADDDVQINAAITAIKAGSYTTGAVQLTEGNFSIGSSILLNNGFLTLRGVSGATVLTMKNGANADMIVVSEGGTRIMDMEIRGNKANNASGSGIVYKTNALQNWIYDVRVQQFKQYGIELQGGATAYSVYADLVRSDNNDSHGWYLHGGGGHQLTNVLATGNGGSGFYLNGAGTETQIAAATSDSNSGYGFWVESSIFFTISSWRAQNNAEDGMRLQATSSSSVTGGTTKNNGSAGAGRSEIIVKGGANAITGNSVYRAAGAYSDYGIMEVSDASSQNNAFVGNTIDHVGTGIRIEGNSTSLVEGNTIRSTATALTYAGTNTLIRNNKGFVTENSGTGTILNTTTSVAVTHNLGYTPTLGDITITLGENPTNTPGAVWVDTIGAANFTVNVENDPGASNLDFAWSVRKH